jgi:hypothetical protein
VIFTTLTSSSLDGPACAKMSTRRETAYYFLTLEVLDWGCGLGALALEFFLGLSAKMVSSACNNVYFTRIFAKGAFTSQS